jgi:hypothetical protein
LGVALFWLAVLGGIVIWFNLDGDNIVGHLRYQITYGVDYAEVYMRPRPKDCDFWTAPMGNKNCTYKPTVAAYDVGGNLLMYGDPSWRVPKGLNLKRVIVDWTTITGHALRDVRSILDANYPPRPGAGRGRNQKARIENENSRPSSRLCVGVLCLNRERRNDIKWLGDLDSNQDWRSQSPIPAFD